MKTQGPVDPATLKLDVHGVNLLPGTFGDQLADGSPTLLVFLRHLG